MQVSNLLAWEITFFFLDPPDRIIIYCSKIKRINMNHVASIFKTVLSCIKETTFGPMFPSGWKKKHWLKLDQAFVTHRVMLGTHMPNPGVTFFCRKQMASKILFWISKSLVLGKLVYLPPFSPPCLTTPPAAFRRWGECYKICLQTVIMNA